MPREQINYPGTLMQRNPDGSSTELEPAPPAVHVAWSPDEAGGTAQVGLEMDARMVTEQAQLDGLHEGNRVTIYTGNLNRQELNHLIRVLRRARNAAYGADE